MRRGLAIALALLVVAILAATLGAVIARKTDPGYSEDFTAEVINVTDDQTNIVIETDDGKRIVGLLASQVNDEGVTIEVGDLVSGQLIGDEDAPVVFVDAVND